MAFKIQKIYSRQHNPSTKFCIYTSMYSYKCVSRLLGVFIFCMTVVCNTPAIRQKKKQQEQEEKQNAHATTHVQFVRHSPMKTSCNYPIAPADMPEFKTLFFLIQYVWVAFFDKQHPDIPKNTKYAMSIEDIVQACLDIAISLMYCATNGRHYWICVEQPDAYKKIQEHLCYEKRLQAPAELVSLWSNTFVDNTKTSSVFEQMLDIVIPQLSRGEASAFLLSVFSIVECHKGCLDNSRLFPSAAEMLELESGEADARMAAFCKYVGMNSTWMNNKDNM